MCSVATLELPRAIPEPHSPAPRHPPRGDVHRPVASASADAQRRLAPSPCRAARSLRGGSSSVKTLPRLRRRYPHPISRCRTAVVRVSLPPAGLLRSTAELRSRRLVHPADSSHKDTDGFIVYSGRFVLAGPSAGVRGFECVVACRSPARR